MAKDTINVGLVGFGTVGSGLASIMLDPSSELDKKLGFSMKLAKIVDKDITTDRGVKIPDGILTNDLSEVLDDPAIDIVVELVGGTGFAGDLIMRAINAGKHVVSANKALLAHKGGEIFAAASARGVEVGFEASVAGGIPIIKVMKEGLVANRILSVYGIINGTANYILSRMTTECAPFGDVLADAQKLGYAEADPTFDIEGIDAAHKLTILGSLAFGIPLAFDKVYTEGITKITPVDIAFASEFGYRIKLLGIAKSDGSEVELRVHPTMIPEGQMLAKVDGVFNALYVDGDAVGATMYYGRGAGSRPTGSAVLADIVDIARNIRGGAVGRVPAFGRPIDEPLPVKDMQRVKSSYYFRFSVQDRPGVLSKIAGILGNNSISIESVIQKGRKEGGSVPLVILTHEAVEENVTRALAEINALESVDPGAVMIRVEGAEG
ncbi:MAG: homoserine dehydrogenase [Nitrospirae bacterium]|nr:homoserine dehydrogenase [Nitrospirota bacterium]